MSTEITPTRPSLPAVMKSNATLLFGMLGLIWVISLLGIVRFLRLNEHGIHPRSIAGLWGIPFAPFLHARLVAEPSLRFFRRPRRRAPAGEIAEEVDRERTAGGSGAGAAVIDGVPPGQLSSRRMGAVHQVVPRDSLAPMS